MIFTDLDIYELNGKLLVIHPMLSRAVTGVGYDMHIGYYVKVHENKVEESGIHDPAISREMRMEAGSSVFIITYERLFLSRSVAGTIHAKGSYAAQGLFLNSTTVDPLWSGQMVFLLTNHSPNPVSIDLSKSFGTIVFQRVRTPSAKIPRKPSRVLVKFMEYINGEGREPAGALDFIAHPRNTYEEEFRKIEKKAVWFSSFLVREKLFALKLWRARKILSTFAAISLVWVLLIFEEKLRNLFPEFTFRLEYKDNLIIVWSIVTGIATIWSLFLQYWSMRKVNEKIVARDA